MDINTKKPNFFIIGAPKCGTTALSEYLRGHPDIFFSRSKEPNFFNTDFRNRKNAHFTEEDYLNKHFLGSDEYGVIGEGSPWYLYSEVAVPNILKFNPEAKFIILVRDPIKMYYSFYRHRYHRFQEDAETPEEAWRLQVPRKKGERLPKICPAEVETLQYGEVCKLGKQLERVYGYVPKDQVKVLFFDDLKTQPRELYKETLDFLDLPDDGRTEFPKVNARKTPKSETVRNLVVSLNKIKKQLGIKKAPHALRKIKKLEMKKNRKESERSNNLSEDLKKELSEYFSKDVDKLSNLTGRDLSHWLQS